MSLINDLLTWSQSCPEWQRDAMRRIAQNGSLSKTDINELVTICRSAHGLENQTHAARPLESHHLPRSAAFGNEVRLLALDQVVNVNALAPNQALDFAPTGLTIVYGDNGTGKSSYSRILKEVCRARGASPPIQGNVHDASSPGIPSATLRYSVAGETRTFRWSEKVTPPSDFADVCVFDSFAANTYASQATDVAFRPFGLDILEQLAITCEELRQILNAEKRLLSTNVPDQFEIDDSTEAGQSVANLSILTNLEELQVLSHLTSAEKSELSALRRAQQMAASQSEEGSRLPETIQSVEELGRRIAELSQLFSQGNLMTIRRLAESLATAREFAQHQLDTIRQAPLPGVGSDEWKHLWQSAEAFSTGVAYPSSGFPKVESGSKCVLCHQELDLPARSRLSEWKEAFEAQAQKSAEAASHALQEALVPFRNLGLDAPAVILGLHHLRSLSPQDATFAETFLESVRSLTQQLLQDPSGPRQPVDGAEAQQTVGRARATLQARHRAFRQIQQAETREAANYRLLELESRLTLNRRMPQIRARVSQLRQLAALENCLGDTRTHRITNQTSKLTKKYITSALRQAFESELQRLSFSHMPLELASARGKRGVFYHQISLTTSSISPSQVASEGEARCLSLAGFLAEITTSGRRSAILFDDPVSSLDHHWRLRVAQRLVEEARERQVVVLSHDLVFVLALHNQSKDLKVACKTQYLRRSREGAGVCMADLPWPAMPVAERVKRLRDLQVRAAKLHHDDEISRYETKGQQIYGLLRETWERAIEEVLLSKVVERYRPSIETRRVRYLTDISEEDLKIIDEGMTKSSMWFAGHDHASAINAPFPSPQELLQDIDALEEWRKSVNRRRK